MSGGGSTQQTSQNIDTNKDVWAGAKPYIGDILGSAQGLYNTGAGTQTWGGPLVAGLPDYLTHGQRVAGQTAGNSVGMFNPTLATALGMSSNGSGLTAAYDQPMGILGQIGSGQNQITTGGAFGNVAQSAAGPTAASQYLTGMAGSDGSTNPWLQQQLDANANRIGNRVASQMSGAGRYGSFGHADALARSVNESNLPLLSSAYEADQGRKLAAAGQIDASRRAADATQLAALTGQTGVQGQNIGNQLGAAGQQAGILNFGQGNAQNWAGMLPGLNALQYDPATRMMGIGGMQQAQSQADIDAQRALFEQQQNVPWTALGKYASIFGGIAPSFQNAGQTTGTVTGTNNTQKQYGMLDYVNSFGNLFSGGNKSAAATGLGILGL